MTRPDFVPSGPALKALILSHCTRKNVRWREHSHNDYSCYPYKPVYVRRSSSSYYTVHTPIHVFKKVIANRADAIANLIIPAGAVIYVHPHAFDKDANWTTSRKMRATEAFVHSIATCRKKVSCNTARSGHDSKFKYTVCSTVKPTLPFDYQRYQCGSGIHFFVNLADAKGWGR